MKGKSHKGFYKPGKKYMGDPTQVVYRSSWELSMMKWLDRNDGVIGWFSEYPIPYINLLDEHRHTYYVDFLIHFKNGQKLLVEVKPEYQTKLPEKKSRVTKKYVTETMTYAKNVSKWVYAKEWAKKRGYGFKVFTENELKKLGIKIIV